MEAVEAAVLMKAANPHTLEEMNEKPGMLVLMKEKGKETGKEFSTVG